MPPRKRKRSAREGDLDVADSKSNGSLHLALKQDEMLEHIFLYLSVADRRRAAQVCVCWRNACSQPSLWRGVTYTLRPGRPIPIDVLRQRQICKIKIMPSTPNVTACDSTPRGFQRGGPDAHGLTFFGCDKMTDAVLRHTLPPSGFPGMAYLCINFSSLLTDASVDLVTRSMPNLVSLALVSCSGLTNTALLYVALRLRRLVELNLDKCGFSKKGICYLAGRIDLDNAATIRRLRASQLLDQAVHLAGKGLSIVCLRLYECLEVTNEALLYLSGLTELHTLDISRCRRIGNLGVAMLAASPNLRVLKMSECHGVSDSGLGNLVRVPSLLEVDVSGCGKVTTRGIRRLARGQSGITTLDISDCGIESEVLSSYVDGFDQLRCLYVDEDQLTLDGMILAFSKFPRLREFHIKKYTRCGSMTWVRYILPPDCVLPERKTGLVQFLQSHRSHGRWSDDSDSPNSSPCNSGSEDEDF